MGGRRSISFARSTSPLSVTSPEARRQEACCKRLLARKLHVHRIRVDGPDAVGSQLHRALHAAAVHARVDVPGQPVDPQKARIVHVDDRSARRGHWDAR